MSADSATSQERGAADFDKFRLRNFAEHLVAIGEAEVHAKPIAMADLAATIAETPKAVVFRDAGPEHFEIVAARAAAAAGSRRRLASTSATPARNISTGSASRSR